MVGRAPQDALATMLWLHDRYALDGDDPNTYTNILWCFGLHDRPWPERPIYGTIRSMGAIGDGTKDRRAMRTFVRSNIWSARERN